MPTASRLAAAVLFGALAYFVSVMAYPLIAENRNPGAMVPINTAMGIICGWRGVGREAGQGYVHSFGAAMNTLMLMLIWVMLIHSTAEMIRLALRKQYSDTVEALGGIFLIAEELMVDAFTPEVMMTLFLGSVAAGMVTEFVGRRYP